MNAQDRDRFDLILEAVLAALPESLLSLLDEAPLIVEDRPSRSLCRELDLDSPADLCGLHSGIMLTERSVEHSGDLPTQIHIFREGIAAQAGGWPADAPDAHLWTEIRTTVLHEIGHHFGLEEDDLEGLGFA